MRELFDEVAGKSPLDPEEAVRRATRVPQRKRFYKEAGVTATPGVFCFRRRSHKCGLQALRTLHAQPVSRVETQLEWGTFSPVNTWFYKLYLKKTNSRRKAFPGKLR